MPRRPPGRSVQPASSREAGLLNERELRLAELEAVLAGRDQQLAEALRHQTATAEVLAAISPNRHGVATERHRAGARRGVGGA